jgi:hypothetical protein
LQSSIFEVIYVSRTDPGERSVLQGFAAKGNPIATPLVTGFAAACATIAKPVCKGCD